MFSTRKKRRQNGWLLSQLDDFDQDVIFGDTASSKRQTVKVNSGPSDNQLAVNNNVSISVTNENTMEVRTLVFFLVFIRRFFVYVMIYGVVAGKSTLISISNGLESYIFCQKMEKTRSGKEEMDGKVFIYRWSRHFSFVNDIINVLFPICTSNWRVNIYVSRQGKGINRKNEITNNIT